MVLMIVSGQRERIGVVGIPWVLGRNCTGVGPFFVGGRGGQTECRPGGRQITG